MSRPRAESPKSALVSVRLTAEERAGMEAAAEQDALRRIKHWGFAVPRPGMAHWTPGIPSLMAHVRQLAEDAGVLPPSSSG